MSRSFTVRPAAKSSVKSNNSLNQNSRPQRMAYDPNQAANSSSVNSQNEQRDIRLGLCPTCHMGMGARRGARGGTCPPRI